MLMRNYFRYLSLCFLYLNSDHNTIKGGLEAEKLALQDEYYRDNIVVIPGVEYSYVPYI